jgi:hypothetical protein
MQPTIGPGDFGNEVAGLHEALRRHGIEVSAEERRRKFFGPTTREAVARFESSHGLQTTGAVPSDLQDLVTAGTNDRENAAATVEPVLSRPVNGPEVEHASAVVSGRIVLQHGEPAARLKVRLYQLGLGSRKLLNEVETNAEGDYVLPYAADGRSNVEVHVVGLDGRDVRLSDTVFGAGSDEHIDLIAPSSVQPAPPEFSRLSAAVAAGTGGTADVLKNAVELDDRRDITVIANLSGWDPGSLALAAEAFRLEERTLIPAEGLYALSRAGMPMDVRALARYTKQTVTATLRRAAEAGIMDAAVIDRSAEAFVDFLGSYRFSHRIEGAPSSPREFIAAASVSEPDRTIFAQLFREQGAHRVWDNARSRGVSPQGLEQLQVQGKIAYLTFNNADLTTHLATKITSDPRELIPLGYYDEAKWQETLDTLSGGDPAKLSGLIPTVFTGRNLDERQNAYAAELARRVRQMDPHAVTLNRIETGEIAGITEREGVRRFLDNATPLGYRLGTTPLSAFIAHNAAVWKDIDGSKQNKVLESVRTISALYAASPSDEALSALLQAGFSSATAVAMHDYSVVAEQLKPFLSANLASKTSSQVYWKAQQQSTAVFNVFDGLKRLNSIPYAPGSSPKDAKARDDQIARVRSRLSGLFPTVESLFGSVDYCECSHCRSVLSPAAYLVDLLRFLDPSEEAWATIKGTYETRTGVPFTGRKPFDVLNDRRPDLKNIALSCANTNTALPYIDVVIELLEQLMISDESPPALDGYDVGDSSSEDLMAEPRNIHWGAYVGQTLGTVRKNGLRDLNYPVGLPFDLPLEMVRAFLKQLDLPLWRLRQRVASPSGLYPSAPGKTDGWTDVWLERLGLGPTDISAIARTGTQEEDRRWYELFGYDSPANALKVESSGAGARPAQSSLRNARTLSRRLRITYDELVQLMRTRFVNPEVGRLLALKEEGVDPHTLDDYLSGSTSLSVGEKTSFEAHLRSRGIQAEELRQLRTESIRKTTLVLRSPGVGCDFAQTTLDFDLPPSNPDADFALAFLKMNAIVRLRNKLGWAIHEVDRVLMALTPAVGALTMSTWPDAVTTAIIHIAHLEELRERFRERLTRDEILTFWTDIPSEGVSNLFQRMFGSSAVLGQDPAFRKRLGVPAFATEKFPITEHLDSVGQALRLSYQDIDLILETDAVLNASDTQSSPTPSVRHLNIRTLSILTRYAALAKGLGVSLADLMVYLEVSERQPMSPLHHGPIKQLDDDVLWHETIAFVREVEAVQEAGTDVAFLDRICRNRNPHDEPLSANDPVLLAIQALPPSDPKAPEKRELLLTQTMAAQLSVPEPLIDYLLGTVLKAPGGESLKAAGFSDAEDTERSLRKVRQTLDLIGSLGITQSELVYLKTVESALNPDTLNITEVTARTTMQGLRNGLTAWLELAAARQRLGGPSERMLAVFAASKQPVDASNTFNTRKDQFYKAVSALTGRDVSWLETALEALGAVAAEGQAFTMPALSHPAALERVLEAFESFIRLGFNPTEVIRSASTSIDEAVAQKVRSSLKGRYSNPDWRQLVKPIFDGLRKKQRDALVAYLTSLTAGGTARYGDTPEKLFEYLLLDPGTEPVVAASRIQLAISSIQTFVQRCLMNLEQGSVDPEIIDRNRWEWMRRYRVWEVNRKMFIWTENWLDPEFRDDKTHLFRELEGSLLQGDVNDDLVRGSLFSYVKGLEEIARLEILSTYFEAGSSADNAIIHVVGCTPNAPHKYFYRRASHGMWTPWEPVDVGIEGRHLVLTSWRGRMHLFWLSFLEQAKKPTIPEKSSPGTEPVKLGELQPGSLVKLQLHWVEQTQGKWDRRASTPEFVETGFNGLRASTAAEKDKFHIRALLVGNGPGTEDDDLEIHISQGDKAHRFRFFSKLAPPSSKQDGFAPPVPPFLGVTQRATKWHGSGALRVGFVSSVTQDSKTGTSVDNDRDHTLLGQGTEFDLIFPSNESLPVPAWTPPTGVGRPSGFVFRPQNACHIAYRSADGSIHDLLRTESGWFYTPASREASERTAADNTEPAASDPHGYPDDYGGRICIAYAGAIGIHELIWSQLDPAPADPDHLATGWRTETLYEGATQADHPRGRPFGGVFLPRRGVVFKTQDGRLRAVTEASSGGPWVIRDLTIDLPGAASDPTGLVLTQTQVGVTTVMSRHIFYVGLDGNIHGLRSGPDGLTWTHANLSQAATHRTIPQSRETNARGPGTVEITGPAIGAGLCAYAPTGGSLHIAYKGSDGGVYLLSGSYPNNTDTTATSFRDSGEGSWTYASLHTEPEGVTGDPVGYFTADVGEEQVLYKDTTNRVIYHSEDLHAPGEWTKTVLEGRGFPKPESDLSSYSSDPSGTQHVVYFTNGQLSGLYKTGGSHYWLPESYQLENPFPDPIGPLAAPFFYEASGADHTFFVEPYLVETSVHEWTEWIITTEDYVPVPLDVPLVPLNPGPVTIIPSNWGLVKNLDGYADTIFDNRRIARTPTAFIAPRNGGRTVPAGRDGPPLPDIDAVHGRPQGSPPPGQDRNHGVSL